MSEELSMLRMSQAGEELRSSPDGSRLVLRLCNVCDWTIIVESE